MTSNVIDFRGYVETTEHALRLVLAARHGIIPRVNRRLSESERRTMIKSGAVFVFSTQESGIKRWTDGYLWSPSRIVGNFLVYREILERAGSRGPRRSSDSNADATSQGLSYSPTNSPSQTSRSVPDQGILKPGGLIKKTITVILDDQDHHLVAYYTQEDLDAGRLLKPSAYERIMSLHLAPHLFRLDSFRIPPKVVVGNDGDPYLVPENESEGIPRPHSLTLGHSHLHNVGHEHDERSYGPRFPSSTLVSPTRSISSSRQLSSPPQGYSHRVISHGVTGIYGSGPSRYAEPPPTLPPPPPVPVTSPSPSNDSSMYERELPGMVDDHSVANQWYELPPPMRPSHASPPRRHRYPDREGAGGYPRQSFGYRPAHSSSSMEAYPSGRSTPQYRLVVPPYNEQTIPSTPMGGSPTDSEYSQSVCHPTAAQAYPPTDPGNYAYGHSQQDVAPPIRGGSPSRGVGSGYLPASSSSSSQNLHYNYEGQPYTG